jgi:tetratricopeptide (TPR) repeat protein
VAAGSAAYRIAGEHDSAGREDEALQAYREAFALGLDDAELPEATVGFGSTLRNVGELEESEAVLRDGVSRFPDYAPLRVFLALTCRERRDHGAAFRELVEALFRAQAPGMERFSRSIRAYAAEL